MLQCSWCGEVYQEEELVDRNDDGFWCDACEGFTFFNSEDREKHRLLLLLEDKSQISKDPTVVSPVKLRKHLSPLRYPGGKSRLINYLYTRFSEEKMETFVEVFAGGASLGLSLLDAGVAKHLILNDKDSGVYALWWMVIHQPQELVERLYRCVPTHRDLEKAKFILSEGDASLPEMAWSFLLANRLSYSGIVKANPLGGKAGSQEALLARWNPRKLEERILHIYSMRDRIEIHNKDACDFLLEAGYWHKNATCFIDPPLSLIA